MYKGLIGGLMTQLRFSKATARSVSVLVLGGLVMLAGGTAAAEAGDRPGLPVVALPGYQVSLFARGSKTLTGPDPIVVDRGHVFVAYQNGTAKDGSDGKSSSVVEYTLGGEVVRTFSIVGH